MFKTCSSLLCSVALLVCFSACNSSGSSSSSGSAGAAGSGASGSGGSKGPAVSAGCPDDAFRDDAAGFCVVLPKGFAKDKTEETGSGTRFDFKGPDYGYFSVIVHKDASKLAGEKEFIEQAKKKPSDPTDVVSDTQTPPQGDGAYRTINFRGGATSQLDYIVQNNGKLLKCYSNTSKDKIDSMIETCKTLRGLSK